MTLHHKKIPIFILYIRFSIPLILLKSGIKSRVKLRTKGGDKHLYFQPREANGRLQKNYSQNEKQRGKVAKQDPESNI